MGGDGEVRHSSKTTVTGRHAKRDARKMRVSPSTSDKKTGNAIRPEIVPEACWKLEDICFDFDSAFVRSDAKEAFDQLAALRPEFPLSPLTLFGHADPVGQDAYNCKLSERRATAVYGVLVRDAETWEEIYGHHKGGLKIVQSCLAALGHDPGPIDGLKGSKTRAAIRSFEEASGLPATGQNTPDFRRRLFLKYMDHLCPGLVLKESEFLGGGRCAVQGCGEFNPLRMFSKKQNDHYKKTGNKTERNQENQPNRRVIAFLLRPGTKVDRSLWPCWSDPVKCRDRFWTDEAERRKFQEKGREHREDVPDENPDDEWTYEVTSDTFACRFYDRIAHESPCEEPVPPKKKPHVQFDMYVYDIPVCGVTGNVARMKGNDHDKTEEELLVEAGTGACKKKSWFSKVKKAAEVTGKLFKVSSWRKMVMNARGTPPLAKDMAGDAVRYDGDHYPTERGFIVPHILTTQGTFDEKRKIFDTMEDQSYETNEVVVLWDADAQKMARCVLDGEEVEVEVED